MPAGAAASRSRKTCCFSSSFSGTASTTTSVAAASSNDDGERQARDRGVGVGARQLAALDPALDAVATGGDVLQRALERTGVDVVADRLVSRGCGDLRDARAHHARAQHADSVMRPVYCGRSMRASQSPGAASSFGVGSIAALSHSRLRPASPARSTTPSQNAWPCS